MKTPHYFVCAVLMIAPSFISGQTREGAEGAIERAKVLGKAEQWDGAEVVLVSALGQLSHTAEPSAVQLWNELGHVHEAQRRLTTAEDDYGKAIRINQSLPAPNIEALATSINNLGTIAEARRQFASAEILFRRALSVLATGKVPSAPISGSILTNLAMSIERQGRLGEPLELYQTGLKLLAQSYGETSAEYAKALSNFGLFTYEKGDFRQASELLNRAYTIDSVLPAVNRLDKALTMGNRALVLMELGNLSEAEVLLRNSLALQRSASASESDLAWTLNNIATLEQRSGHLESARRDITTALQMVSGHRSSGGDRIQAVLWSNLGRVADAEEQTREAKRFYRMAIDSWIRTEGNNVNYAAALSNLAAIESREGHRRQAHAHFQEALTIEERALGPKHPRVANDLVNVGIQMLFEHQYEDALKNFERAQRIEEEAYGHRSVAVARALRLSGVAYEKCERFEAAESAYREAIDIWPETTRDSLEFVGWLAEYGNILAQENKFSEAEAAYVRANGIRVRNAIAASKEQRSSGT